MPTAEELKQVVENPRNAAMKNIVKSRMNDIATDDGKTLMESLEDQGVELADPDAPLEPEVKDSDTGDGMVSSTDHQVDIADDEFKTNAAQLEADAEEEEAPEAKADEEAPDTDTDTEPEFYSREGKTYTKIKVNGEEQEVEAHTLKASYQKDKASFKRFQDAAKREQDIEARERALEEDRAKLAAQAPAPEQTQRATLSEEQVDSLYDALSYDDEDTVKAKIAEMLSGQAPTDRAEGRETNSTHREQPVDIPAEINAALDARAQKEWEASKDAALAEWEVDYSDIADDEELRYIAHVESGRIASAHPTQDIRLALQQAGDFARKFAGDSDQADVAVDSDAKKARKQKTQAPLRTNSKVAARTISNDKPPTRSETVAQIRAARGQSVA